MARATAPAAVPPGTHVPPLHSQPQSAHPLPAGGAGGSSHAAQPAVGVAAPTAPVPDPLLALRAATGSAGDDATMRDRGAADRRPRPSSADGDGGGADGAGPLPAKARRGHNDVTAPEAGAARQPSLSELAMQIVTAAPPGTSMVGTLNMQGLHMQQQQGLHMQQQQGLHMPPHQLTQLVAEALQRQALQQQQLMPGLPLSWADVPYDLPDAPPAGGGGRGRGRRGR
jgi:hypothetical protein